jgi:hypothetical protein
MGVVRWFQSHLWNPKREFFLGSSHIESGFRSSRAEHSHQLFAKMDVRQMHKDDGYGECCDPIHRGEGPP